LGNVGFWEGKDDFFAQNELHELKCLKLVGSTIFSLINYLSLTGRKKRSFHPGGSQTTFFFQIIFVVCVQNLSIALHTRTTTTTTTTTLD
jgi:hypothetical protein